MRRLRTTTARRATLVVSTLLFLILASAAKASPTYTIIDLGTLPGTSKSIATGINDTGQVVGVSYNNVNAYVYDAGARSFLYSNGQLSQVTPVGGGPARAINDAGEVVGGPYVAINNSGQYLGGLSATGGNALHNPDGSITDLGYFTPFSINDSGQIAGAGISPAIWTPSQHKRETIGYPMSPWTEVVDKSGDVITFLEYYVHTHSGTAIAINNKGDVLVTGQVSDGSWHSFLVDHNGGATDLTSLPGGAGMTATALNDSGQVVGGGSLFAGGKITPLNDLIPPGTGWDLTKATGINDAGAIIGQGMIGGQEHAFLLAPQAQPVPEPTTIGFAGLCTLLAIIRRRARMALGLPR